MNVSQTEDHQDLLAPPGPDRAHVDAKEPLLSLGGRYMQRLTINKRFVVYVRTVDSWIPSCLHDSKIHALATAIAKSMNLWDLTTRKKWQS